MKKLILTLAFTASFLASFSQDILGFTFQATSVAYSDSDFENIFRVEELFNASFKDEYLVHTVYSKFGDVSESQFYKIISLKVDKIIDGYNITFYTKSGISGSVYKYTLHLTEEYEILNLNDEALFGGVLVSIKTYKQ